MVTDGDLYMFVSQFADIASVSLSLSYSVTFSALYVHADTTFYLTESTFTHLCSFFLMNK